MNDERLNSFIEEHDMHSLADPTENIPVGSIYEMDLLVLKCRRVGTVANFVEPPVTLPDPDKKGRGNITRNFRNTGQTNIIVSLILKAFNKILPIDISGSFSSDVEKILELNYKGVTAPHLTIVSTYRRIYCLLSIYSGDKSQVF